MHLMRGKIQYKQMSSFRSLNQTDHTKLTVNARAQGLRKDDYSENLSKETLCISVLTKCAH